MTKELSKKEALSFYNSGQWKNWPDKKLALFQLRQDKLSIPFDVFHKAVEGAIGRPVWTHEFANPKKLIEAIEGE